MSIPDMDGPRVRKQEVSGYNYPICPKENKPFAYIALIKKDSLKSIEFIKVYINEIIYVSSSQKGNAFLYELASISFYRLKNKKTLIERIQNKEEYELINLDAPYYSECFYSEFSPYDKINLEDMGKTKTEALESLLKRKNKDKYRNMLS